MIERVRCGFVGKQGAVKLNMKIKVALRSEAMWYAVMIPKKVEITDDPMDDIEDTPRDAEYQKYLHHDGQWHSSTCRSGAGYDGYWTDCRSLLKFIVKVFGPNVEIEFGTGIVA